MSSLDYVGGIWDPGAGTFTGPPPGGRIAPFRPVAGRPYSLQQWQALPAAKRQGFANRGQYLRWWERTVAPKLKRPPQQPGQGSRMNPATGAREAVAGVDNTAAKAAAGIVDPTALAYERMIRERERAALGQAEATKGIMAALAAFSAGDPEAVRSAYQTAADRTVAYAGGLTGATGEAATGAAQQAAAEIARLGGPGTVTTETPAISNVLNYTGGVIPGTSLAFEAANRMAEMSAVRFAGGGRIAEQGVQAMREGREEIAELRSKLLEWQAGAPGRKSEADLAEREMALKERAFQVQVGELQLARAKNARDEAEALTNLTGYVHRVVGTGAKARAVRTKEVASGSKAYTAAQTAETSRAASAATNARITAQNRISNDLARARIGISRGQLDIAAAQEARLQKGKAKGGYTPKMIADFRGNARGAFSGLAGGKDTKGADMSATWWTPAKNPKPSLVIQEAINRKVPWSIVKSVMQNLYKEKPALRKDPVWQHAAANWW